MAYVDKPRTYWRLRDRINGKLVTVIKNLGIWRGVALVALQDYEKARQLGMKFEPPITNAFLKEFLLAQSEGRSADGTRILVSTMCDLYLKHFGPSVKGGVSDHHRSAYNKLRLRLEQLKRAPAELTPEGKVIATWGELHADEVNLFHVRDLLNRWTTAGTRMRNLGAYGAMFHAFEKWNKRGNVLPFRVKLPSYNPFSAWRSEMKPAEKKEYADKRVLSKAEWDTFKVHLTVRARQICEIALQRLLRVADIKKLTKASQTEAAFGGYLKGIQEKTGEIFLVPQIPGHPVKYDFTNFRRDFEKAQEKAGMLLPASHPLHFSVKDLRRTGATWIYKATHDLVAVSKMLGHQKLSTTQRYLNLDETDLFQVAKIIDKIASSL